MKHVILGLLDVKLQEQLVLDQPMDAKYLVAILNFVKRIVVEIHVYMSMELVMIMTIAQMLLPQISHFANPSLHNVFQHLQPAELLHYVINMKI